MSDNPFELLARAVIEHGATVESYYDHVARTPYNDKAGYYFYLALASIFVQPSSRLLELPTLFAFPDNHGRIVEFANDQVALAARLSDPLVALHVLAGGTP